MIDGQNERTN
jgi:hypothetical protein